MSLIVVINSCIIQSIRKLLINLPRSIILRLVQLSQIMLLLGLWLSQLILVIVCLHHDGLWEALKGFLLLLAHDEGVVEAIYGSRWLFCVAHDLLVVEGRDSLQVKFVL